MKRSFSQDAEESHHGLEESRRGSRTFLVSTCLAEESQDSINTAAAEAGGSQDIDEDSDEPLEALVEGLLAADELLAAEGWQDTLVEESEAAAEESEAAAGEESQAAVGGEIQDAGAAAEGSQAVAAEEIEAEESQAAAAEEGPGCFSPTPVEMYRVLMHTNRVARASLQVFYDSLQAGASPAEEESQDTAAAEESQGAAAEESQGDWGGAEATWTLVQRRRRRERANACRLMRS